MRLRNEAECQNINANFDQEINLFFVFIWNISKTERRFVPVANRKTLIANVVFETLRWHCCVNGLEMPSGAGTCIHIVFSEDLSIGFINMPSLCILSLTKETHLPLPPYLALCCFDRAVFNHGSLGTPNPNSREQWNPQRCGMLQRVVESVAKFPCLLYS